MRLNTLLLTVMSVLLAVMLGTQASAQVELKNEKEGKYKLAAENGFDSKKLTAIGRFMDRQIDAGKVVGCSGLIFKDNKLVFQENWGLRHRRKELPVEDDTIWRIYSMTKPITSVAVMQLVEKGDLELDANVSKYLPEFKDLQVQNKNGKLVACRRPMTIRDLLRHTSGLTYGFFGNTPIDKAYRNSAILVLDKDLAHTVTKLSKIPLLHQPGKRWHYSVSTDVLGRIIEVVSEKSFQQYLQENVFDPLEMKDTFFSIPEDKQKRLAEMYMPVGNELKQSPIIESLRYLNDTGFCSGGGGLCSTMHDYLQFARMVLNEGELNGKRLLSKKTIAMMTKNQIPNGAASRSFRFGLGFAIDKRDCYSWGGAAGTRFWVDPKNEMVTIFMIQIKPDRGQPREKFRQMVYDALEK